MAAADSKRKRAATADEDAPAPKKAALTLADVDEELKGINDLLQTEETSQKQTWQIGKRVKKILDGHPELPAAKQLDAFFLWGTALARLASLNDDPTLAAAAADKFDQMHELSQGDEAAFGPVGFSLWASSLLIVATETQDRTVLDMALTKFEKAVEVDGGTTFETRFQYAKALKEGGDLVRFLEDGEAASTEYYQKAVKACGALEKVYESEAEANKSKDDDKQTNSSAKDEEEDDEHEVDEDDDVVTEQDFAEVKLLEAILHGTLESSHDWSKSFDRTLALYYKALELSPNNPEALMELTNYLSRRCLAAGRSKPSDRPDIPWAKLFDDLETRYERALKDVDFPMSECHEICVRCDTVADEEPDMDGIDVSIPHLLNSLGKGLCAYLRAFPEIAGGGQSAAKSKPKGISAKKKAKRAAAKTPRFIHAVEVLRSAHHLHDKLGAYHLSTLFACPAFEDEQNCREWLETAASYGALEDGFEPSDFEAMHDRPWFQKFLQPEEMLTETEIAGSS